MKYIKKFNTSLNYQNNKLSNDYNTPFLGYTEDIDYVYFDNQADNETDDKRFALIGDWVLAKADGSKLFVGNKIYQEKYVNSEEWTPIAKVVIPYNVFGDKVVRCVSLNRMDPNDPQNGSARGEKIIWGSLNIDLGSKIMGLKKFIYGTSTIANVLSGSVRSASDLKYNGVSPNPRAFYNVNTESSDYGITMYIKDMPLLKTLNLDRRLWDGKYNTLMVKNYITADISGNYIVNSSNSGNYPAVSCCIRYLTIGTNSGDWYLPSIYELLFLYEFREKINIDFSIGYSYYCSSTYHMDGKIFDIDMSGSGIYAINMSGNPSVYGLSALAFLLL